MFEKINKMKYPLLRRESRLWYTESWDAGAVTYRSNSASVPRWSTALQAAASVWPSAGTWRTWQSLCRRRSGTLEAKGGMEAIHQTEGNESCEYKQNSVRTVQPAKFPLEEGRDENVTQE
jgi:hypothetical protein